MNYYAQGGQAHGLKSLAQELPKYGRYGDDVVAHISSDEARMLQAMGGSGTINPQTGLPEFFRNPFKPIQRAVGQLNPLNKGSAVGSALQQVPGVKEAQNVGTQIFQPFEKAIVQPASRGLAQFDKAVGNTIPGGWGTVGTIAASMIPGGQFAALGLSKTAAMTGLGALTGSGVMRPGRSFNLQGALVGGAVAYGSSQLADYMAAAGGAEKAATLPTSEVPLSGGPELLNSVPYEGAVPQTSFSPSLDAGYYDVAPTMSTSPSFDPGYMDVNPVAPSVPASAKIAPEVLQQVGGPGSPNFPSVGKQIMSGDFSDAARQIGSKISDIPSNIYDAGVGAKEGIGSFIDKATTPSTYKDFGSSYTQNVSDIGSGIKNLLTDSGAAKAATAATGINPMQAAGALVYGGTGLIALDEQEKFLKESRQANAISQAEYDSALADINRQRDYAQSVVNQSPFNPNPNRDVSIGETFYGRSGEGENLYDRMQDNLYTNQPSGIAYAMGGQVDDELGGDYSAMNMDQGNMQKGLFGMGYAEGGMPRFLSGGGDGMSDSIKATINEKQPARLADGEFVIPADVVSHLGNGSSKAGAKQLYSMMDKVRKARTGNHKQGKQINPRKYMPA
jgi:hypothetical protein